MEIEHLREFIRVIEEGSFSRAAAGLNISQPGLSKHVAALEKRLGVELLVRNNAGVSLTPAGRLLYDEAQTVLQAYDGAMERFERFKGSERFALTVDSFVGYKPGDDMLVGLEMAFREANRSLELSVRDVGSVFQLQNVVTGAADLCLYAHHRDEDLDVNGVVGERLFDDPLVAIVRDDHHLAGRDTIWMAEIGNDVVWMYNAPSVVGYYDTLESILRANGADPQRMNLPWVNARSTYQGLPYFKGGVHIVHRSVATYSLPLASRGYRVLGFYDTDANYGLYVHYRSDSKNPAVPLALEALRSMATQLGEKPY